MKVSHSSSTALLIIDMLNTLEFLEWRQLLKGALPASRAILKLKTRAKNRGIPVIYVNDNFGQWRSNWEEVYRDCVGSRGKPLAERLKPEPDDYFVLKPKHSGFYSTTLDVLLENLGSRRLILTGIAGNICVLFTANDAYMRDFEVIVPRDCIASNSRRDNDYTLRQLKHVFGIETKASSRLSLKRRK